MILQQDLSGTSKVMFFLAIGILILIAFESRLPDFNYSKSWIMTNMLKNFTKINVPTFTNTSDLYYFDASERNFLTWMNTNGGISALDQSKVFPNLESNFSSNNSTGKALYLKICQLYLPTLQPFTNASVYKSASDKTGVLNQVKGAIPQFCRILVGNLNYIFDQIQLTQYFSVVLLNGINNYFINGNNFDVITNFSNITAQNANAYLNFSITANMQISQDYYNKALACKSSLIYNPGACVTASDFANFSQATMNSVYGVDYTALNTYFQGRLATYNSLAASSTFQNNYQNLEFVVRHLMFRCNLVMAFESNIANMRAMLKGAALSNVNTKNRCNEVFFFTISCVRKNIMTVIPPLASDTRSSGNEMRKIEGNIAYIQVGSDDQGLISNTILANIGQELTQNPTISAQVFYWSFYDANTPPDIPT